MARGTKKTDEVENKSVDLDVAVEDEAATEITAESTAIEAPAEAVPKKKMVKRRLFKDNDKYQADVFVCVNGKAYTIKRGVDVEIPEEVAEVLDNADDQMMVAAQKMDELTYRDPK